MMDSTDPNILDIHEQHDRGCTKRAFKLGRESRDVLAEMQCLPVGPTAFQRCTEA